MKPSAVAKKIMSSKNRRVFACAKWLLLTGVYCSLLSSSALKAEQLSVSILAPASHAVQSDNDSPESGVQVATLTKPAVIRPQSDVTDTAETASSIRVVMADQLRRLPAPSSRQLARQLREISHVEPDPILLPAPGQEPIFPQEAEAPPMVSYDAYPSTCPVYGVYCPSCPPCQCARPTWKDATLIPWDMFAQGEYIGPARLAHIPEYRLRVDDLIDFVYLLTADPSKEPYRFDVGDRMRISSMMEKSIDRDIIVQPDGNITAHLLGQVRAAGRTIEAVRNDLEERYKKYIKDPAISVTPLEMNSKLNELRNAVDARFGEGGQGRRVRVTPEGTVQLPGLGSVPAQGLTLGELKQEVDRRYAKMVSGIEITPILVDRAPRYVYVLGHVERPGRIEMSGPTTVMQALAMAGSFKVGAGLHQIVIFRRDENWEMMATVVDMRHLRWGKNPCPAGELWLRDSDIMLVPRRFLENANEIIGHVFTRGAFAAFPTSASINFARLSTL